MKKSGALYLMLAVVLAITSGCTFTTRNYPGHLKAMEEDAAKQGVHIDHAYSNFVGKLPGFTMTGSATHLTGAGQLKDKPLAPTTLVSSANAPTLQFVPYSDGCSISNATEEQLRAAVDVAYLPISAGGNWRDITIEMRFVPFDVEVQREVRAFRVGRKIFLRFYYPCSDEHSDRDVFRGVLSGVHETSHLMLSLRKLDGGARKAGSTANEEIADGGPACVYRAIKAGSDPQHLLQAFPPDDFFNASWELDISSPESREGWCDRWIDAFK